MNRKQLKALISAGVFSATLLSGAAYAKSAKKKKDAPPPPPETTDQDASDAKAGDASKTPGDAKEKQAVSTKSAEDHGCGGANGCGGSSESEKK